MQGTVIEKRTEINTAENSGFEKQIVQTARQYWHCKKKGNEDGQKKEREPNKHSPEYKNDKHTHILYHTLGAGNIILVSLILY